jgi:hypothetical protein
MGSGERSIILGDKCDVQEFQLYCVHGCAMDLQGAEREALYWVTSVMFRNSSSIVFMDAPWIYREWRKEHYIG